MMAIDEPKTIPISDGVSLCLHSGTLVRTLVQPSARYTRTSAAPVKGMIRREAPGPPFHRSVCSRCGAWAVNLYWSPVPEPVLLRDPGARNPLSDLDGILGRLRSAVYGKKDS
jgi:hypothetical protein